jgi:hypothetical protein
MEDPTSISNQEHGDPILLHGKKRPLNDCPRSMIPPHGVNSNIHDEASKLALDKGYVREAVKGNCSSLPPRTAQEKVKPPPQLQ